MPWPCSSLEGEGGRREGVAGLDLFEYAGFSSILEKRAEDNLPVLCSPFGIGPLPPRFWPDLLWNLSLGLGSLVVQGRTVPTQMVEVCELLSIK